MKKTEKIALIIVSILLLCAVVTVATISIVTKGKRGNVSSDIEEANAGEKDDDAVDVDDPTFVKFEDEEENNSSSSNNEGKNQNTNGGSTNTNNGNSNTSAGGNEPVDSSPYNNICSDEEIPSDNPGDSQGSGDTYTPNDGMTSNGDGSYDLPEIPIS